MVTEKVFMEYVSVQVLSQRFDTFDMSDSVYLSSLTYRALNMYQNNSNPNPA